jgi:N6-adenosine-specific RNA methylase IME4
VSATSPNIKNHFDEEQPGVIANTEGREHSRPDEMIPLIERLFDGPYLELFATEERPGWACVGDQIGKFAVEAA